MDLDNNNEKCFLRKDINTNVNGFTALKSVKYSISGMSTLNKVSRKRVKLWVYFVLFYNYIKTSKMEHLKQTGKNEMPFLTEFNFY